MPTIRNTIEQFIYPKLEFFTDMVYRGGEDTEFLGIRVLDDDIKFTHGALVNAAATLYVHYVKFGDSRAATVLDRMHYFIKIAAENVCKTWGKLAILRGFNTLNENGLLSDIKEDYINLVKAKTEYDDFFDKEKLDTRGMATNYMQVAMACAGFREKLGWEADGYAKKICDKLTRILETTSDDGWLDDEIPYGRYDRYSFVLGSEFADTATEVGLEVPKIVKDNLMISKDAIMFMANEMGDGILYGRSVAAHGDNTIPEVISSAFAQGLMREGEKDAALAYSMRVIEKTINFWFDSEKNSFNIWWAGRSTNRYRSIERILETNLDLLNHLYSTLKNFQRAGVADAEISCTLPSPKNWIYNETIFKKNKSEVKEVVFLRHGDILVTIPFVGTGKTWGRRSAYCPFPVIPRKVEASPLSEYPFMIPEYMTGDGVKYRPCQYYTDVTVNCDGKKTTVSATGYLATTTTNQPSKSDYTFTVKYVFDGLKISAEFTTDLKAAYAETVIATSDSNCTVVAKDYDAVKDIDTAGREDFSALHGEIKNPKLYTFAAPKKIDYAISF